MKTQPSNTIIVFALAMFFNLLACMGTTLPSTLPAPPSPLPPSTLPSQSTGDIIYYVRPDSGSAEPCTGLADAPVCRSGDNYNLPG
jgi:hypothetical protein